MIVIILFFAPDILHKQDTIMREIVDKHFADNWVVAYYMGYTIDLSMYWEPYKAAKTAIGNTCKPQSVKELAAVQASRIPPLIKDCVRYLTEGVLTDELVLDNTAKLLQHLRCCNAAVRWVLLHKSGSNPKLKEFVQTIPTQETLSLLLKTADLEDKMKNIHDRLLDGKEARWTECKTESMARMQDLCDYFGGKTALSRGVKADEKMAKWFGNLGSEIGALDSSDPLLAGRKIQQLQSALKEVEQFHQIDTNTSVKNYLAETCEFLKQMLRTVNVRDETTSTLAKISDFGYAFEIIHEFLDTFHAQIKQDPFSVLLLRATFLKIVSVIEVPLLRIQESESSDLESVAQYYSSHIVAFIRLCLEVVPVTMFRILTDQILTNSSSLKAVPTRFDRALLKDFAQVEERFKLAAATYQVSVFTDGVLAMRTTLVGSIPVNPKELLEDGIRKELVRQISIAMHGILIFRTGKTADFEANLERLEQQLQNFRKSFEYISDYVNIYGLKIWQEEFGRIISFNVEQECNTFLKQKVYEWQSQWQNAAIPIPSFPSIQDDISRTFMGRLIREILHQTDPRRSVYIETRYSWYALDGKEILGIRGFNKLHKSVSTIGLCGLDKLLSFMIVEKLQTFVKAHRREAAQGGLREMFSQMQSELTPTSCISVTAPKLYSVALQRMSKLIPALYSAVTFVGQAQLLRRVFASELNFGAQLDSNLLYSCLGVLNGSVLNDLRDHYRHPDQKPYPQDASTLLPDISSFLDAAGLASPIHKIYIATEPLDGFALAMFLFTISQMPKFAFDKQLECLVCRCSACAAEP
jgi:WASH complex subunit strumpellin